MMTLMQSQVFFFISSVGFIVLAVLTVIVLVYILRALDSLSKILKKIEHDIDSLGEITKEMFEELKDTWVFRVLFPGTRKRKK